MTIVTKIGPEKKPIKEGDFTEVDLPVEKEVPTATFYCFVYLILHTPRSQDRTYAVLVLYPVTTLW